MELSIGIFIAGFLLVIKGGDYFVDSSVAIAEYLRVPRVFIGTTIVSLATTSPELIVSVTASAQGNAGFALGNALGSVIANAGLIGAAIIIFRPCCIEVSRIRMPAIIMLSMALVFFILTLDLHLSPWRGVLLLTAGVAALTWDSLRKKKQVPHVGMPTCENAAGSIKISIVLFLFGSFLIVVGSKCLLDSGIKIAAALGIPPMIVGLTAVALGTSLPELVTAVSATLKGVPDLSVGNIIGANIMNMSLVAGTATVIAPLHMNRATQLYNFPAMLAIVIAFLLLYLAGFTRLRRYGMLLLALYIVYIAGLPLFTS